MTSADSLNASVQGQAVESGKGMSSGVKGGGGSEDGGVTELYKVNQIWYRLPPTLSLVAKRTLLVNQFQRPSYDNPFNQSLTCIMNTGEYYVSMPTSYLYMEIGYNDPQGVTFHPNSTTPVTTKTKAVMCQGNAMSLFEEVSFISASGTELNREQNKGLQSSVEFRYNHKQEYIDTAGTIQGASRGPYSALYDGTGPVFDTSLGNNNDLNAITQLQTIGGFDTLVHPRTGAAAYVNGFSSGHNLAPNSYTTPQRILPICIPMDQLIGCFKPYMNTLFPAGALAGGRLDIRMKSPLESLQFIAGCVEGLGYTNNVASTYLAALINMRETGFVINKIYIVFDAFQLQDNVLRRLNQISAGQNGLSMLFDTYDHTVNTVAGSGSVEVQVQQARSRIIRSYCVVRDTANLTNPYINSLASESALNQASIICQPGYTAPAAQAIPLGTGGLGANTTGFNGGYTIMTMFNTQTAVNGSSTTGANAYPTLISSGTTPFPIIPIIYPFQVKPRLPTFPLNTGPSNVFQQIVSQYQSQLGALFFPQQPLTTVAEYYQNALYMFGKCFPDKCDTCSVTYEDFVGGLGCGLYQANNSPQTQGVNIDPTGNAAYGAYVFPYGLAIYGFLAEKSQMLSLSGLPISNARSLRHKFTFAQSPLSGTTRTINAFTTYTRVAKVFLGGRVVVRE